MNPLKKLVIFPIKLYQKFISPLKPPCCRFTPSCSQYAIEAVMEWGVIIGLLLALWRILRCNPFSKGGEDPVPINRLKRRFLEKIRQKRALKKQKNTHRQDNNQ
ncbi:MAG: membrane protein insertion efficiency factor YidD [Clostridia bacterium]|nr:membrane protein insertion efficiency factor YidD [Clostridia bacterium]